MQISRNRLQVGVSSVHLGMSCSSPQWNETRLTAISFCLKIASVESV